MIAARTEQVRAVPASNTSGVTMGGTIVRRMERWTAVHAVVLLGVLAAGIASAATMRTSTPVGPDTLRLLSTAGPAVAATGSYRMDMTFAMEGGGVDVEVRARANTSVSGDATGELDLPDGRVLRFLATAERGWFELPEDSPIRLGGQRWVGFPSPPGAAAPVEDPLVFLSALSDGGEVRDEGAETVRGVGTRHYRAELDAAALLEQAAGQGAGLMTAQLAGVDVDGELHLWLSDDGLPRRVRVDMEMDQMEMLVEFELDEFGEAVVVTPPPTEQVLEVESQQEAMRLLTSP